MNLVLADLRQIVEGVLFAVAALLPIVNPFGTAPIFVALTQGVAPEQRAAIATRVALNSFILMLASLFIGTYVLDFFGLSVHVVQVGGGLVVCATGWTLLRKDEAFAPAAPAGAGPRQATDRAFYPLTLPLTVGPGAITVAITIGAYHRTDVRTLIVNGLGHLIGITIIAIIVLVCYRYADRLARFLGATGMSVLLRLSAFILLCIGVQIVWNGASYLLATLPNLPAQ
jgi:multiple antibiotic resistance protein